MWQEPGQVFLPAMANRYQMELDEGAAMKRGFCIFIQTVCEGAVPRLRGISQDDGITTRNGLYVFRTELEAQREIADFMMTRLQEFMDGERDFEDAITVEEYVVDVSVDPDGVIWDEFGNRFE